MTRHFFAILLFAASLAALPCRADDFSSRFTPAVSRPVVPAFTFKDGRGRVMDLKEFRGDYVLVNLWATWCGPCVQEMAGLDTLAQRLSAGQPKLDIVALTEDHNGLSAAQGFYRRYRLSHLPVFVDESGQAPSILHVRGLPTTILVDPGGVEIGRIEGDAVWDDPHTVSFLEKQMKRVTK